MTGNPINSENFLKSTENLRDIIGNFKSNILQLVEQKSFGKASPILENPENSKILKQNIVSLMDLRIKHREIQTVFS